LARDRERAPYLIILHKRVSGLSASSLERFVLRARRAAKLPGAVNVMVTSSAALRALNREFRGKNKATDVLSFPSASTQAVRRPFAGEIAISADMAVQNALHLGHSTAQEVKVLALHGILHLAGFDHERDNGVMARKEAQLRRRLRLPVALIERTEGASPSSVRPLKSRRGNPPATRSRA